MDFRDAPADAAFRAELRAWLAEHHPPAAELGTADRVRIQLDWQRELHAGGWVAPSWPAEWGGRGATPAQVAIYHEEMTLARAPNPINTIGVWNIGPMLIALGTQEQKNRWLAPMLSGEQIWCQGFSEPDAGTDLASLRTRAVAVDGGFLVTGRKVWTTYADFADLCLALVRTDPEARPHEGISALVVDMHAPGVQVRPIREITGHDGFNEITFDDVLVPAENLVGELNRGWHAAMSTLANERVGTTTLGIQVRRHLGDVIELARATKRGRGTALEDPIVRDRIARMHIDVETTRILAARALSLVQRGEPPTVEVALGKLVWSRLWQQVSELAVELQGAAGLQWGARAVDEGRWQHAMLYSRMATIGAGTTEIQKNIIAQRGLGLPRAT